MDEEESRQDEDLEQTIKFCNICKNLLEPSVQNDHLTYFCERKGCDFKLIIEGRG